MWRELFGTVEPALLAYSVWEIHLELASRGWVRFVFNEALPCVNGRQTYGQIIYDSGVRSFIIRVHNGLDPWGPRFCASLSHEIGHFVLHRKLMRKMLSTGQTLSDRRRLPTAAGTKRYRMLSELSDRQWLEWEANEFMCAMCLPRKGLAWRIAKAQNVIGIYPGLIRIDEQACNQVAAAQIISSIAVETMIQSDLVHSRMRHFGYIVDVRSKQKPATTRDLVRDGLLAMFS